MSLVFGPEIIPLAEGDLTIQFLQDVSDRQRRFVVQRAGTKKVPRRQTSFRASATPKEVDAITRHIEQSVDTVVKYLAALVLAYPTPTGLLIEFKFRERVVPHEDALERTQWLIQHHPTFAIKYLQWLVKNHRTEPEKSQYFGSFITRQYHRVMTPCIPVTNPTEFPQERRLRKCYRVMTPDAKEEPIYDVQIRRELRDGPLFVAALLARLTIEAYLKPCQGLLLWDDEVFFAPYKEMEIETFLLHRNQIMDRLHAALTPMNKYPFLFPLFAPIHLLGTWDYLQNLLIRIPPTIPPEFGYFPPVE